jgi:hypothetical protein
MDEPFLMTTWHAGEAVEDVVFFALNCTNFEAHDFKRFLLLVVGEDRGTRSQIERLIRTSGASG